MTLTRGKNRPAGASATAQDIALRYEPTKRERATLDLYWAQKTKSVPLPGLRVTRGREGARIEVDHQDLVTGGELLMGSLGATSPAFLTGLLCQLVDASGKDEDLHQCEVNFMLSVVKGIEPKDEIEAMLAAQMAAVQMASMACARRLAHAETPQQQDSAERAFNRLARTFTTQMEALKRYRTGGQQKMTVEHVTVQAGGQAIVGNVSHPGGGSPLKSSETTP
jgi:hypothetical protein